MLFVLAAIGCSDKLPVTADSGSEAELGVSVSLGDLQATDISSVRVVARYVGTNGSVVLRDVTQPYSQGESRSITVALDLAACLRETNGSTGTAASCPVQVTVDVLAGTRLIARDELPVVQVRAGQKASVAALAARNAASIVLRSSTGTINSPIALNVGGTATLAADALDGSGSPIAGRTIVWSSSDVTVASVTIGGVVSALAPGTATISATNTSTGIVVRGTATVNVAPRVPASVVLTPLTATVDVGASQPLAALVRDGFSVTITPAPVLAWTTSQASVATVSATGVVTGVAPGTATISARTANGVTGTSAITVVAVPSVVLLSPPAPSLAIGASQALTATVNDGAGAALSPTPPLVWSTSAANIATVSQTGVVTAVAAGTVTISARLANGVTGSTLVTVLGPPPATVAVSPATASIAVGGTQALTIVARDATGAQLTPTPAVTWSSSRTPVATVSASGVVSGVTAGEATITALTANGITGTASIAVAAVPARLVLAPLPSPFIIGDTETLSATVSDAAGVAIVPAPALVWTASAPDVAAVSQAGVVTAVTAGTSVITARTANGITGTTTATVLNVPIAASLQLAPTLLSVGVGSSGTFTPTARDAAGSIITRTPALSWQTSNPGVATVSSTGIVTGVSPGFASITARTSNGLVANATVTVGASGSFAGRVFAYDNGIGVAGAGVTISVSAGAIRGVTTDAQGNFNTGTVFGGPFTLRVAADGFVPVEVRNLTLNSGLGAIPLARIASGDGSIVGAVSSATTNLPIPGFTDVELYSGINAVPGTPVASGSAINGNYRFDVPAGTYTLLVRAPGFTPVTRTVVSLGGGAVTSGQHVALSPVITNSSASVLRIILTWGDEPADLDAYLVGPLAGGGTFNVNWDSRGSCTSSPFACLDQDATDGRGPESITIAEKVPGIYTFYVHNYTDNDEGPSSPGLSRSDARVNVYSGFGLLASFVVPSGPGTLWTVFEWDGATVRPINTLNGNPPPAASETGLRASSRRMGGKIKR